MTVMKTKLLLAAMVLFGLMMTTTTQAQRDGRYHTSYSYGDGYYGNNYRNGYSNYDRYYNRMSRSDRKCLKRLLRKLEDRKYDGWRDGYLNRREVKRIRDVERDIDKLMSRYRRNDRYANYGNRGNNGRGYNGRRGACR